MTYDLTRCLLYLVPGASFGTTGNDYALTEWRGPGDIPTEAAVIAAWPAVQAQMAAEAQAAVTAVVNRATLESRAADALAVNKTYIGRASPTALQTTAQVKALSQECSALIRLLLSKLDATD